MDRQGVNWEELMNTKIPPPIFVEFTAESAAEIIPNGLVSPDLVDKMNQLASSDELSQSFKDNLISFNSVLTKGAFTPSQYVSAVQFVSYRLMGLNVRPAWEKTFPERYAELLAKGTASKAIHSSASAYNKTKLVTLVMQQSLIPSYIVNNSLFQDALNLQMNIALGKELDDNGKAASLKVRSDAAAKVLEYTAIPDSVLANKEEVSEKGLDIISALAKSVEALAEGKRGAIIDGAATAQDMARMPVYVDAADAELADE